MIHYKINRILFLTIYVGGQKDLDQLCPRIYTDYSQTGLFLELKYF